MGSGRSGSNRRPRTREAQSRIEAAKHQIRADVQQAETELQAQVEPLSEQIISSLLRRRAA